MISEDLLKKVINRLSWDMARIYTKGNIKTQWPISASEISPLVIQYLLKDFSEVAKEMKNKSAADLLNERLFPTKISQMFFLLLDRNSTDVLDSQSWREMFYCLMDKLSLFRKDVTLETSIEMKENLLPECGDWTQLDLKKGREILALCDSLNEISHPIYRGYGYEIFEQSGHIFRYYHHLKYGNYSAAIIREKVLKKPVLDFFGRVIDLEDIISMETVFFKNNSPVNDEPSVLKDNLILAINNATKENFDNFRIIKSIAEDFKINFHNGKKKVKLKREYNLPQKSMTEEMLANGVKRYLEMHLYG